MSKQSKVRILGLDLGPNSVGWAIVDQSKDKKYNLIDTGVRVFQAGLDGLETDGKGKSRNMVRREARGRRRLLERRKRRMIKLANALKRVGLLPDADYKDSQIRHFTLESLDQELRSPYELRAMALDEKLELYELGRAIYHLGQRRGFLSNRKSIVTDEAEEKGIKAEINGLSGNIEKSKCRTLGEYLFSISAKDRRVRDRYTSRKMYETEFEAIWTAQKIHNPELLTDDLKKTIHKIIFHQRPLKSQKGLVGRCELEWGSKRAPQALLISQRFRYLITVNNLKVMDDTVPTGRELIDEERDALIIALENEGDQTFAKIRKLLGLSRFTKFNLELGGEKRIPGNRTALKLKEVFGAERWNALTEGDKNAIIADIRCIVKDDVLKKRSINIWGLNEKQAERLAQVRLDDSYFGFSQKAIKKLMPLIEKGVSLQTAIKECYPERWERDIETLESLPPVDCDEMPDLRNPIVFRTLTELRRVVNAIIKKYGKPDIIRIELARDLRQSSKQRERTWKKMRTNERNREKAAQRIIKEANIKDPSRTDILKVVLADECDWTCPYSGERITIPSLLGDHPQFDIEHIIPFDRCLDDSFVNKTLCLAKENRSAKRNQTPFEAYGSTAKWQDILTRIKGFKSDIAREKLRRFILKGKALEEFLGEYTSRQLNDTRWASKWAKQFLGLLYGGVQSDGIEASGKKRVQAISGPVTAYIRNLSNMNSILGDGPGKSRDDHRHHAVDAIVVAITNSHTVSLINKAAKSASEHYRNRLFDKIPPINFELIEQANKDIKEIVTSHRVSNRIRGSLHKDTIYGKLREDESGKTYVHQRKPLVEMSKSDIDNIVDPVIREIVQKILNRNSSDPKKIFSDEKYLPEITTGNGKKVKIRKARIKINMASGIIVGNENHNHRHVYSDSNHHIEYFEVYGTNGEVIKWEGRVVSLIDAYRRKKNGESIINREPGENKMFLFSLAKGDIIELANENGNRNLYTVRILESGEANIRFTPINDERTLNDIGKKGFTAFPNSLRKKNCKKLTISPLGILSDSRN